MLAPRAAAIAGSCLATCTLAMAVAADGSSSLPASGDRVGFEVLERTDDGIAVSRKPGRSDGLYVLRLETHSPVAPDALADSLWRGLANAEPPVARRTFLKREPTELVFHDRVKTPIVSDRDYTMVVRRSTAGDIRRVVFQTAPELGPPPDPDCVRLPIAEGFWEIRPDLPGGSLIRYQVYSEPGGSVPAFFVRDPQLKAALDDVRRSLTAAAKKQR